MSRGLLTVVLHAHLPFVRHPDEPSAMEERWLFEAVVGCYLPLLHAFEDLEREAVPARLVLSLSPTLTAMLDDDLLRSRCGRWIDSLVDLAAREVSRTGADATLAPVAAAYLERFETLRSSWRRLDGRLTTAFGALEKRGRIELATSTATHAFFPGLGADPASVHAQVETAADAHARRFGRRPDGIWLGECGYVPGVEHALREAGIRFFFVDAHALRLGEEAPVRDVHAPVYCPGAVAAFARDDALSPLVWDAKRGYPGDPAYRDFYRDIGFDLPLEDIGPWVHPDGHRMATGIKYHAITHERLDGKRLYEPAAAARRVRSHADHFAAAIRARIRETAPAMDRAPLIVLPFDAELFGHWWFEGVDFLAAVFRRLSGRNCAEPIVEPLTPIDYLRRYPTNQCLVPALSSWGAGGYGEWWINEKTAWIWPPLHEAAGRMARLAQRYAADPRAPKNALDQAARELLLAQSSDWPFILRSGTTTTYAERRLRGHLDGFDRLCDGIEGDCLDETLVAKLAGVDNILPDLDFRVFATRPVE